MFNSRGLSLTEGPLFSSIVRFSLPLMLSNVLQVLFNMSDIAVVGRFAGAEALGAVGSCAFREAGVSLRLLGAGHASANV